MMKRNFFKILFAALSAFFVLTSAGCGDSAKKQSVQSPSTQKISLDGKWKLSFAQQPREAARTPESFRKLAGLKTIPAVVPGNVEIDILREKLDVDPMIGDNVYKYRKYESYQWMYSREFDSPALSAGQRAVLDLEGVDTLADVFVNGKLAGSPENMFVAHRYDITDLLNKSHKNKLDIIIRSAPIESKKFRPTFGGGAQERSEFLYIRKAPSGYGWDIHPRLVTAGLWKNVSLDIENPVRITDVNFFVKKLVGKDAARVGIDFSVDAPYKDLDLLSSRISFSKDGKEVKSFVSPVLSYINRHDTDVKKIEFWWPRGYGAPALYDLKVELFGKDKKLLDSKTIKVGFRTVRLEYKELALPDGLKNIRVNRGMASGTPEKGAVKGEFKFYVNDVPVFVKGTNWVPLDASHSRDIQHVEPAMKMIADLNCNMIRCWGGNVYESDLFYDLCDKYGVLVWQDFSMGCSVYPQHPDFERKIYDETLDVVKRLRNHPCIALWAGNNENDTAYGWRLGDLNMSPNTHDMLTRKAIPAAINELDWTRSYIPSSPYISSPVSENPQKFAAPEAHLWGPRGYYKAPFYRESLAVFVSEIGYHGCPNRESLEKMMHKDFVYPWTKDGKWNKEWQCKATMPYPNSSFCVNRNSLMTNQAKILFGAAPSDLDDFIFASQVVQAEAKKYFIEMWRTQKFDPKTGILWWNLRDAWPILSDAIVDYYNSKKLAYYYIKRAQNDVCAMMNDDLEIVVANDTLKPAKGKVCVRDIDSGKTVFESDFAVESNGKTTVGKVSAPAAQGMFVIEYSVDGGEKQLNHYMYGKPPFKLGDYKKWYKELKIDRK